MPTEKQTTAALSEAARWHLRSERNEQSVEGDRWFVFRDGVELSSHEDYEAAVYELARASMVAALAAAEAAAWEPIETSPDDGSAIIVFDPRLKDPIVIRDADASFWRWMAETGSKTPTHWRPLPTPPQEAKP